MLKVLRNYGVTTPAQVIPTGIRIEQFSQGDGASFRERFGIPESQPLLLFVGRVALEKNIQFLIEVMAEVVKQIPDALLLITGEGPARETLHNRVTSSELSSNIRFLGYLDRDGELENCYCAADLFVFASRTETQGLVLLEAMTLGTPVVSTAVMGTGDVLENGQGCIVAQEELNDFSSKVVCLLKDDKQRHALSVSAQSYAEKWSAPVMAQKMADLYSMLAGEWDTVELGCHPTPSIEL
jgi:glycosyltransferase involved in cell wall biosynthesis